VRRCARARSTRAGRSTPWPEGAEAPSNYWLSSLPADAAPERLARLARLRWKIELDYRELKGELGLDHYEGRSWLGWHHHTALVTAAHGFPHPGAAEPKSPTAGLTLPKAVLLLQPLFRCWTGRCQTCQRSVDLDHLPLRPTRWDE